MFPRKPAPLTGPLSELRPSNTASQRMSWRVAICWLLMAVALVYPEGASFGGPAQGNLAVSRKVFTPAYFQLGGDGKWMVSRTAVLSSLRSRAARQYAHSMSFLSASVSEA